MIKELEVLNDYVDGYLGTVYEEIESNLKNGKTEFLENFRACLASVPSKEEGEQLVKLLNRGLLRSSAISTDVSLNKRKGFEEALVNVQNKIKELFKLEDLVTGTVQQYLQDVPRISIVKTPPMPDGELLTGDSSIEEKISILNKEIANIEASIIKQRIVMEEHLANNGKLIIISDNGFTNLDDIDGNSLEGLIDGSKDSIKKLKRMAEIAILMLRKVGDKRNRPGKSPLDGLLGNGEDDE